MHRTQVLLDEDQYRRLKSESLATGRSLAEIIRGCVGEHLRATRRDPLLDLVGSIEPADDSAPSDLSEQHDQYLYVKGGVGGFSP